MIRINLVSTGTGRRETVRKPMRRFTNWVTDEKGEVSPIKSISVGLAFNVVLQVIFVLPVPYLFLSPTNWIITISLGLLFFAAFGVLGMVKISIAHAGVLTFFGKRIEGITLKEGWHWLLPRLFMAAEEVSLKLRTTNIPKLTVVAGEKDTDENREEEGAETAVEIEVDAAVQWEAKCPFRILSIGEEVIDTGLVVLVSDILREEASKRDPIALLRSREEIRIAIKEGVDRVSEEWGIDTKKILIGELLIKSQETRDSFERITRERRQRQSEMMNTEARMAQAEEIKKKFPSISDQAALDYVAAEAGTLTRKRVDGTASDLIKAASTVGSGSRERG